MVFARSDPLENWFSTGSELQAPQNHTTQGKDQADVSKDAENSAASSSFKISAPSFPSKTEPYNLLPSGPVRRAPEIVRDAGDDRKKLDSTTPRLPPPCDFARKEKPAVSGGEKDRGREVLSHYERVSSSTVFMGPSTNAAAAAVLFQQSPIPDVGAQRHVAGALAADAGRQL